MVSFVASDLPVAKPALLLKKIVDMCRGGDVKPESA